MNKNILVLLLCLGVNGCAFNDFTMNYNNALKTKTSTTITKEGNYQELNEKVTGYFEARGYKEIIFTDQKKMFFVFEKQGDFQEPCQIILKYTVKPGSDTIRVDLVKESDDVITDDQVSFDILKIADQIRNE